jgi:hypothetical protein
MLEVGVTKTKQRLEDFANAENENLVDQLEALRALSPLNYGQV